MGVVKKIIITLYCDTCGKIIAEHEKCWVLKSKASKPPYYFCSSKCEKLFKLGNQPLYVRRRYTTSALEAKKSEIARRKLFSS